MTVLVVLPNPSAGHAIVGSWKARLTDADRLYVVSFGNRTVDTILDVDVHYMDLDRARERLWGPRIIRSVGWRLVWSGIQLWDRYLSEIWEEFLWTLRSFDPDVLDA